MLTELRPPDADNNGCLLAGTLHPA